LCHLFITFLSRASIFLQLWICPFQQPFHSQVFTFVFCNNLFAFVLCDNTFTLKLMIKFWNQHLVIMLIITNFVMFLFVSFYFILTRTSTIWLSSCLHSLWLWLHYTCTSQLCQAKVFLLNVSGFCISFLFFCRFFFFLVGINNLATSCFFISSSLCCACILSCWCWVYIMVCSCYVCIS